MVNYSFRPIFAVFAVIFGLPESIASAAMPKTGINVPELAVLDQTMENFMVTNSISAGSLALSRNGTVIFFRNYGWMDQGKTVSVREDVMMRIASCTKPFTAAAIRRLISEGKLSLSAKVFSLGVSGAGLLEYTSFGTPDSRLGQITVQHLLQHRGGWDRDIAGDLTFMETTIASDMGISSPPGRDATVRWIMGQPLQYTPGSTYAYSSIGYLLLGLIIEKLSGQSCHDYIFDKVLKPLGVSSADYLMGHTFKVDQDAREPFYDDPVLDTNVFYPAYSSAPLVERPYGAIDMEARTGQGRMVTTTPVMLKYLDAYTVNGDSIGLPRASPGTWRWNHAGSQPGVNALARERGDGINYAIIFNKRPTSGTDYSSQMRTTIDGILDSGQITTWPTQNVLLQSRIVIDDPASNPLEAGAGTVSGGVVPVDNLRELTFTVHNSGNTLMRNLAVSVDGANAADFTLAKALPTTLAASAVTTFVIRFKPGALGARAALLHVASNDPLHPIFDISVTATGDSPVGTLELGATFFPVLENAGTVTIPIIRRNGSNGAVGATLSTKDGTAKLNADFLAPTGTLQIADGATTGTLQIPIINSGTAESAETFTINLSAPTGGASLGSPITATVRILDTSDTVSPAVSITSPSANAALNNPSQVNVSGVATDAMGVSAVHVVANGVALPDATLTTTGASSTTYGVSFPSVPGLNSVTLQSEDMNHNQSLPITRSFHVLRPLLATVQGGVGGTVSAGFSPSSFRKLGDRYTITATPSLGYVFNGWTVNDFTGTGVNTLPAELPTMSFIMQDGLSLQANFIANPFTSAVIGTFNGLVLPTAIPGPFDTVGMLQNLKLLSNGSFTGVMKIDGLSLSLSGSFHPTTGDARFGSGANRSAELALIRSGKPSLIVRMNLNLANSSLTGTVMQRSHGTDFNLCGITAYRAAYNATNKVSEALAGSVSQPYTVLFPSMEQTPVIGTAYYPQGPGYATMTLTTTGTVNYAGKLADHTPFSGSAQLIDGDMWPMFGSLYSGKGALAGYVAVANANSANYDISAPSPLLWIRPVIATSQWYPDGWPEFITIGVVGARYIVPPATPATSVFPSLRPVSPNMTLSFIGGLLGTLQSFDLTISPSDVVTNSPATLASPTMKITKTTGFVTGTFPHSDGSKPTYQGVIMQKGSLKGAQGYFMSTSPKVITGLGECGTMRAVAK